jgi:hypothetical protein
VFIKCCNARQCYQFGHTNAVSADVAINGLMSSRAGFLHTFLHKIFAYRKNMANVLKAGLLLYMQITVNQNVELKKEIFN